MCGTSNPQSPASRAVAAFQRLLTLWPQSSSSAAYASTGRYRLKRGAPWCHQQSLSQRQPVLTAPPLRPSPAAQVSRGHFVVGVVFGLLGSGGETLTAGWPIVSWAGAESSEWMALALLVSVSIDRYALGTGQQGQAGGCSTHNSLALFAFYPGCQGYAIPGIALISRILAHTSQSHFSIAFLGCIWWCT